MWRVVLFEYRAIVNNVPASRDECNVSSRLLKFDWTETQLISAKVNVSVDISKPY